MPDAKIGFIGLGAMGRPMARNLLKAGFSLMVYDTREEPIRELVRDGAVPGAGLDEVAAFATHVITMLPGSREVNDVYRRPGGLLHHGKPGDVWIDMSTHEPATVVRIADEARQRGIEMLDAPVSGGTFGAEAATLTIMVGGSKSALERCEPLLRTLGKNVYHCGEVGAGESVKLVNNYIVAINLLGVVEGFLAGVKAGVDPAVLYRVVCASSGQSYALQTYFPAKGFRGDFEAGFTVDLMHKDLTCALALADEAGIPTLLGSLARSVFTVLQQAGMGKKDMTAALAYFEGLTGTRVRL